MEEWLSVAETARSMKVSKRTIFRMLKTGALTFKKEAGRTLIKCNIENHNEGGKTAMEEDDSVTRSDLATLSLDCLEAIHGLEVQARNFIKSAEAFTRFRDQKIKGQAGWELRLWSGIQKTLLDIYKKIEDNAQMSESELKSVFSVVLELKSQWNTVKREIIQEKEEIRFEDQREEREHVKEIEELKAELQNDLSLFDTVVESLRQLLALKARARE